MWIFRIKLKAVKKKLIVFAKHKNNFIFNINSKKLKKKALNPKYKHISKPDFWLYESLTENSYLGSWKQSLYLNFFKTNTFDGSFSWI